jgi:hypothetical protein
MSWPADGKPRYVVGVIHGAEIRPTDAGAGGGRNLPEGYVYDRAYGYRVVASRLAPSRHGAERIMSRIAEELNAGRDPLSLPRLYRRHTRFGGLSSCRRW